MAPKMANLPSEGYMISTDMPSGDNKFGEEEF